MSRLINIAPGEYYHIYNRGVGKKNIFYDNKDRSRFLFLLLVLQGPFLLKNTSRLIDDFSKNTNIYDFVNKDQINETLKNRYVELIAFSLMPNHFHILVKEINPGGIAKYMQRVSTAYTMYFNLKNETSGHLFQGPYKIVHIQDDVQLMHVSAYIHCNPLELGYSINNLDTYKWSSYLDYLISNRFKDFLVQEIILNRFTDDGKDTYKNFIKTSPAKSEFR